MLAVTPRMRFPERCFRVMKIFKKVENICDFRFFSTSNECLSKAYTESTKKRKRLLNPFLFLNIGFQKIKIKIL